MKIFSKFTSTISFLLKVLNLKLLILLPFFTISENIIASKNNNSENIIPILENYIRNFPSDSFYIIGPGDVINLRVNNNTLDLNTKFSIDGEGLANLPRLKKIYVAGLTLDELTKILNKEYGAYVNNPEVELIVIEYRPIKIYLDGEVENPGIHLLPGSIRLNAKDKTDKIKLLNNAGNFIPKIKNQNLSFNVAEDSKSKIFPTLSDVLRKAGGITIDADLSNIEITRINSISNGQGKIKTNVNLLKSIQLKDNSQNIRIMDGDNIFIPKSNVRSPDQISSAIKSNINPKFISIYIAGRVENAGIVEVSKNATLNEAISLVGLKVLKGPIRFLRYKNDGSIETRKFKYRRSAKRGSYKNPLLVDGDIIYVSKSAFNASSEVLSEITSPFQGILSTYTLYKAFSNL